MRLFVVTPDMHRVHHSVIPRETNSNFGFNLPWWDRLCGTYRPQPPLLNSTRVAPQPPASSPARRNEATSG
nr:sterol desaturase family protein [Geobacter sp.]